MTGRKWSGRLDLNQRPPAPEAGALPSCATPRPRVACPTSASALPRVFPDERHEHASRVLGDAHLAPHLLDELQPLRYPVRRPASPSARPRRAARTMAVVPPGRPPPPGSGRTAPRRASRTSRWRCAPTRSSIPALPASGAPARPGAAAAPPCTLAPRTAPAPPPGSPSRCRPPAPSRGRVSRSSSVIRPTMKGCEIVCPSPMGSG